MQTDGVMGCGTYFSYFYFVTFVSLVRIVMLSLFMAIVIESYSDVQTEIGAVITPYQIEDLLQYVCVVYRVSSQKVVQL